MSPSRGAPLNAHDAPPLDPFTPMATVPPPPTPVMLYIGAGYDLSPLLTFAPHGPPYPIVSLPEASSSQASSSRLHPVLDAHRETYTSFLFVDAKPRHTSAYMVADFDEWTSVEARVRNIMRYAQGKLDRWHVVDDAGDLVWFEGGGDAAQIAARRRDSAWRFFDASSTPSSSAPSTSAPLTTLLYLFNTLDVELAPNTHLTHVWPCVEALYVHGLWVHAKTGLDALNGLRRCYVIVGSWGTGSRRGKGKGKQRGVRDVDFVRAGMRKRREAQARTPEQELELEHAARPSEGPRLVIPPRRSSDDASEDISSSPLIFRRPSYMSCAPSVEGSGDEWDESRGMGMVWDEPVACAQRVRALMDAFGRGGGCVALGAGDVAFQPSSSPAFSYQASSLSPVFPSSYRAPSSSPAQGQHPARLTVDLGLDLALDFGKPFAAVDIHHAVDAASSTPLSGSGTVSTPGLTSASTSSPQPYSAFSPALSSPSLVHTSPSPARTPSSPVHKSPSPAHALPLPPFHIHIPQIAWSDAIEGYYVAKSVAESLVVWRAREEGSEGEDTDTAETDGDEDAACKCAERKGGKGRTRLGELLRVRSEDLRPARTRTVPSRLRLRPRAATPSGPPSRPRSSSSAHVLHPSNGNDTDTENSASETEVSEDDGDTNLPDARKETAGKKRGVAFWRRGLSLSSTTGVPFSLFAGTKHCAPPEPKTPPPRSPRKASSVKRAAPSEGRERRIDIADFLSTTNVAADHTARAPHHDAATPAASPSPSMPAYTFPRSPYGPLSLEDADGDATRSCPDLKRGHRRVASAKAAGGGEKRLKHVRSISALGISFGWGGGSGASSKTSPARAASSPRLSTSSRASYTSSDPKLARAQSSSPRRFRAGSDAPPVPPLPSHIPASAPSHIRTYARVPIPSKSRHTPHTSSKTSHTHSHTSSKSTPSKSASSKPASKSTVRKFSKRKSSKRNVVPDDDEWDWFAWLMGVRPHDRMGVASAESDKTKVGEVY